MLLLVVADSEIGALISMGILSMSCILDVGERRKAVVEMKVYICHSTLCDLLEGGRWGIFTQNQMIGSTGSIGLWFCDLGWVAFPLS